ncbi:tryptophan-rich sensory protein [Zhihengliuella halotolerans]|uniref:TspO/MBR related protein n=1 Tax=Zhihengliuella halotolerans TaxID=370736 RepID=A0A4Q8AGX8_9MICC|nr:tryptophan-rich sensory protein [Zhihengliuella halotolerans]RZU62993.1 TspO/MBR related protein [Zhihengliuella halotolerans]
MALHQQSQSRSPEFAAAIVTLLAAIVTTVVAAFGAGAGGGTSVSDAASGWYAADATPLAPATTAFSIWSVIYVGLFGYAILQLLSSRRGEPRQRAVRPWAIASMVLNALWLWVAQAGWIGASLIVIVTLLAVLCVLFRKLRGSGPRDTWETVLVDGTFGLYLGWVAVAVVANTASWLGSLGAGDWGWPVAVAASVILLVVAAVGVALAVVGGGRLAPGAAMAWGLSWIAVGRLDGADANTAVAVAAGVAAAVIVIGTAVARMRHRRVAA